MQNRGRASASHCWVAPLRHTSLHSLRLDPGILQRQDMDLQMIILDYMISNAFKNIISPYIAFIREEKKQTTTKHISY